MTKRDSSKSLANEPDFKLIASKIRRQTGGAKPAAILFSRPAESLKTMYEFARSENTSAVLERQAEGNPFFNALNGALKKNPLPPFEVFEKYLSPTGGMIVSDETGFHYTAFGLKRKK